MQLLVYERFDRAREENIFQHTMLRRKNIWLKSCANLSLPSFKRPVRLRVRTPPFHGGDTSSNLVRATEKQIKYNPVKNAFCQFLVHQRFTKMLSLAQNTSATSSETTLPAPSHSPFAFAATALPALSITSF